MPTVEEPTAAEPKENKKPKAKKEKKAPVKAKKEKPAKEPGAERQKKEGLRDPQIRILQTLNKKSKPMTRAQIADAAKCDVAWLNSWVGSHDEEKRAENDKKNGFDSLLTLGFVKYGPPTENEKGRSVPTYEISTKGKAAVAKL